MKLHDELLWLAKQIDRIPISDDLSLWKVIRETEVTMVTNINMTKRHVYITGEPQVVYNLTDLFDSVTFLNDIVTLTSDKYSHPALQWMDITYYPPTELHMLPKNITLTLFAESRLPFWSRSLFTKQKICNVVTNEKIPAISRMERIRQYTIDDFSYQYLLDDVLVTVGTTTGRPQQQLNPELPKQYIMQLITMKDSNQQKDIILDKIAVHMLNAYWLQNHPPIPQWMPILFREITSFLKIKYSNEAIEKTIQELEVWGNRDKRIS